MLTSWALVPDPIEILVDHFGNGGFYGEALFDHRSVVCLQILDRAEIFLQGHPNTHGPPVDFIPDPDAA